MKNYLLIFTIMLRNIAYLNRYLQKSSKVVSKDISEKHVFMEDMMSCLEFLLVEPWFQNIGLIVQWETNYFIGMA